MTENMNREIREEELEKATGGMLADSEEVDILNSGTCLHCGPGVMIFSDNGIDYTCRYGHKFHRTGSAWSID